MDRNKILEIVIANVNALVETLPEDDKFPVDENTILFGEKSRVLLFSKNLLGKQQDRQKTQYIGVFFSSHTR